MPIQIDLHVNKHGDADRLPQEDIHTEDGKGDGDRGRAVEDTERFGHAQAEHIPGPRADIGLNGQIDAEAVEKEAGGRDQHIQNNRPYRAVFAQFVFHCLLHLREVPPRVGVIFGYYRFRLPVCQVFSIKDDPFRKGRGQLAIHMMLCNKLGVAGNTPRPAQLRRMRRAIQSVFSRAFYKSMP